MLLQPINSQYINHLKRLKIERRRSVQINKENLSERRSKVNEIMRVSLKVQPTKEVCHSSVRTLKEKTNKQFFGVSGRRHLTKNKAN